MWRGWRKWIFFIHSFLYVRHRCTLDAIIIQYLRWVQEMRWRLFCSVHPQFSVLWFSLQISGYCSCCPVSLTEKEPSCCLWQNVLWGTAKALSSLHIITGRDNGMLSRYACICFLLLFFSYKIKPKIYCQLEQLFCLNNWGDTVHKSSNEWMRFTSTKAGMG